jgi:TetR/AcrR family acrAB operon transcriptional repressor
MAMTQVQERPTRKHEQRAASMESLLDAALHHFVSQGYRHTSVEQIAKTAELTKGSIYFYFHSKSQLLAALLERVEAVVVERIERRVAEAGPSAVDKLVAFVHGQAKLGVDRADEVLLLILMSLEFAGGQGPIPDKLKLIYGRLYATVETVIDLGKRQGVFRGDIRTRQQAAIVMAGHDGTFLEWYRRGARLDGAELVRALRISTLAGLQIAPHPILGDHP